MLAADTTIAIVLAVVAVAAQAEVLPDPQHQEVSSPTVFGIAIVRLAFQPNTSK
jgi:hypothetical protein